MRAGVRDSDCAAASPIGPITLAASNAPINEHRKACLFEICIEIGRGDKIRTCDPLHPMQVRYQAAPRPDRGSE